MGLTLSDCPFWPRYLTREHAALYVGVSTDTFDDEVRDGIWPSPRRRGGRGGRLTWDRAALDAAADRALSRSDDEVRGSAATDPLVPAPNAVMDDRSRAHAAFSPNRSERRTQKAR